MTESCKNPWNGKCDSTSIEVYIYYKDKVLPICRHCWNQIAEKDIQWWKWHMHQIDLNMARSHIGRKVNLHLKDGSVIVNVLITNAGRNLYGLEPNRSMLHFTVPINGKISKIPLREIEWMEPVSICLVS